MAGLILTGTSGRDTLLGGVENDTLSGGLDVDSLRGAGGSDKYIYALGDGADTILDTGVGVGEVDALHLTDLNPGQVSFVNSSYSLYLTTKPNGQTLVVTNQFASGGKLGLEEIHFADGTIWNRDQIGRLAGTGATQAPGTPILGGAGDEFIQGTSLGEFVFGEGGADTILGGEGDDGLYGDAGADSIAGEAGADKIYAGDGDDIVLGGQGADALYGGAGNDTLIGGQGADTQVGEGGSDLYIYTSGDGTETILDEGTGAGEVDVLTLTDVNPGGVAFSSVSYGLGVSIKATGEKVTVTNQFESGGKLGIEELRFADGTIWTKAQIVRLTSTYGTLVDGRPIFGSSADESQQGTAQGEFIYGEDGNDSLAGEDGTDGLYGDGGADLLAGGQGADTLYGGAGNDTLIGGQGVDAQAGEGGSDNYVYTTGDGTETILENGTGAGEVDVLSFTNVNPGEVALSSVSYALGVTLKATGEKITLTNQFESGGKLGVEEMRFADGTVWTKAQIAVLTQTGATIVDAKPILGGAGSDSLQGTSQAEFMFGDLGDDTLSGEDGADRLYGDGGSDSLVGGLGGDTLYGGAGDDTLQGGQGADSQVGEGGSDHYLWASGDGTETILDGGTGAGEVDVLSFSDINPGQLAFAGVSNALVITLKATGEKITITNQFDSGGKLGVEEIHFADGTVWNKVQIARLNATGATLVDGRPILGGPADDSLQGTSQAEFIFGEDGADTLSGEDGSDGLYGDAGNDLLLGGQGGDTLYGGAGNDTLVGGQGADSQIGEGGSDTYVFGSGHDSETILENGVGVAEIDVLSFTDVNPGEVAFSSVSYALGVTLKATGEKVTLTNQFDSGGKLGVEEMRFADGTIWTKAQITRLSATNATLVDGRPILGNAGDESLQGTALAEFIFGEDGNDTLSGEDGTDGLYGDGGADLLAGGQGADTLYGGAGNDTLIGGQGVDTQAGEAGSDTYVYAAGDGTETILENGAAGGEVDVLSFTNVNPGEVAFSSVSYALGVTIKATGEKITLTNQFESGGKLGVEEMRFADGTVWTKAQIVRLSATNATLVDGRPILGNSGDESLQGTSQAEFLFGEDGADSLAGGGGGDGLYGDGGADSIGGQDGADTIFGGAGDDTVCGGQGIDQVQGEGGSDTYIYASGDGTETLLETGTGIGEIDVLKLSDLGPGQISLVNSSFNLYVTDKTTGQVITITNQFESGGKLGVEEIRFADGTVWNKTQIGQLAGSGATLVDGAPILGTSGADALVGTANSEFIFADAGADTLNGLEGADGLYGEAGDDVLDGGIGADKLYGGQGADLLVGGEGADSLMGGDGADTLNGGQGSDQLQGEGGGDTYVYASGDGTETILDSGVGVGEVDVLNLSDLNPGQIGLVNASYNLYLTVKATGHVITITNQFESGGKLGVEEIRFADGTVWNKAQVGMLAGSGATQIDAAPILGTSGTDSLLGTSSGEYLFGDAGADTMDGAAGADTMSGGADDDAFVFGLGFGADRITDFTAGGLLDSLDFGALAVTGLSAMVTQSGANTTIAYGADVVTLVGVQASQLVQVDGYHFT